MALNNVTVEVRDGEILAVIGPNGAGKTCLLNCLSGFYRPDSGQVFFEGRDITKISPLPQGTDGHWADLSGDSALLRMSVLDNILAGRAYQDENEFSPVLSLLALGCPGGDGAHEGGGGDH